MRLLSVFRILAGVMVSMYLGAIPNYMRLTGASCASCHNYPTSLKLTPMGYAFLNNGHRLETTGWNDRDFKLTDYFGLGWRGTATQWRKFSPDNAEAASSNTPLNGATFNAGGPISDRFSFFARINLNNTSPSGTNQNLSTAWLRYNQPFTKDIFLGVRVGRLSPEILANAVYDSGQATVYGTANGAAASPGGTPQLLAAGLNQYGVDATLYAHHFEFTLGVVNGSPGSWQDDTDNHKDFYAAAQWHFDDNYSGVGLFRYQGQLGLKWQATPGAVGLVPAAGRDTALLDKKYNRTGVLARFNRPEWRIIGGYFLGEEDSWAGSSPTALRAGTQKSNGYFGTFEWYFHPMVGFSAKYDFNRPNTDASAGESRRLSGGFGGFLFLTANTYGAWNLSYADTNVKTLTALDSKTKTLSLTLSFGF